jgi:hypothetical protein
MLHTIDINPNNTIPTININSNNNINKQPHLLQYWITGNLSPCVKDKNIKINTSDIKKNPKK